MENQESEEESEKEKIREKEIIGRETIERQITGRN